MIVEIAPSSANKNMMNAVKSPISVIIFCFDFHSLFMLRRVIIDVEYAKIKNRAVKEKNCRLLKVKKLARMDVPTKRTVVLWVIIPEETSFLPTLPLSNPDNVNASALELQIIECNVPKIADKIAKSTISRIHFE